MKKTVSILLVLTMFMGISLPAFAVDYGTENQNQPVKTYNQTFKDVPKTYWAFQYIAEMTDRGVINGDPDGMFRPDYTVSRAEFAKIMVVAAGVPVVNSISSFADVTTEEWYCDYIESAKYFLTGYTINNAPYYKPETPAVREDIAVALVKLKGYDVSVTDQSTIQAMFKDYESISTSARPYVATAVNKGLISGYDDETFRGQDNLSRAEAATLLWRA